jgi:AbrB family looped-hinge helix DNA binding protein
LFFYINHYIGVEGEGVAIMSGAIYQHYLITQKGINILRHIIYRGHNMAEEGQNESCCGSTIKESTCCKVVSVVSIDERGQMVLPKDVRDKAGIGAGDKLAVVTWEKGEEVCCISLLKIDELTNMVKDTLGPVMKDVLKE